jgi:hypothetical protein
MIIEKTPAKVETANIGFGEHGSFTAFIRFNYGNACQGFGYVIDQKFIERFIKACGVKTLRECVGRVVMVTHSHTNIHRVEPMAFEKGEVFDIDAWASSHSAKSKKKEE